MSGTPRLSNQAAAAATAPIATPVVLVELDFATGPFRVWTGLGPLDWAGKVFEGAGSIGAISDVEETVELRAVRLTLALSPVPQEVVDIALADGHRRSPGTIAFWGSDTAHVEEAIFGLGGDGLILDRPRFDAGLRASARDAGASLADDSRLRLVRQGDARAPHNLELRIGAAAPQPLRARWLVDASGRAAALARACGGSRILHDRLLTFQQRLAGGAGKDRDGRIWVEAVADGW